METKNTIDLQSVVDTHEQPFVIIDRNFTIVAVNRAYDIMGLRSALAAGLDIDVDINATPSFEKQEFARIRKEQGVKAAIAWRDARFAE